MTTQVTRPRPPARGLAVLTAALALVAVTACGNDAENPATPQPSESSAAPTAPAPMQAAVDRLVSEGFVGAEATVLRDGSVVQYTAGLGDLATGEPYPRGAHVRVASLTKSFTSALVLRLVAEGRVELDAPVDRYLPGLLRGEGVDPGAVTVRHILQHRSGLPEYSQLPEVAVAYDAASTRTFTPKELIELALRQPAQFPAGERMRYTATNYVLAGMLVEKVGGKDLATALAELTGPLGLSSTYLPAAGDHTIAAPFAHGHDNGADVTALEPSALWTAGGLVSSGTDLVGYYSALMRGEVVPSAQLEQMQVTVPMEGAGPVGYGLGLMRIPLACGSVAWGHAGDTQGYLAVVGATEDGSRAMSVTVNQSPKDAFGPAQFVELLNVALC
ncbi:serine hydrolase domain-containing protein [Phytomonospora sp. NPDC050363]|uniref:serine hydrolase domain-containing protein n=1 Tax=Phytomonospora sp. NPDC050363 TaxID=3155642 RepID=UPI0033CBEAEE